MQKQNLIQNTAAYLLLSIALCCFCNSRAQKILHPPKEYIFTTYTTADGLPSSEILSLATDEKSFLWIGTSAGLSRYDGYSFTNFSYSSDKYFIGVVNVVRAGLNGQLWIGASSGLYCYFQNQLIKISGETKLSNGVNDILCEPDGSVWLATESGPCFFSAAQAGVSPKTKILLKDLVLPQWNQKHSSAFGPTCQSIKKAKDGTVYFSNQYQLFKYSNGNISLLHTTVQEHDVIEYIFPVNATKVFYNAAMTGLNKVDNSVYTDLEYEDLYKPGKAAVSPGTWYVGSLGVVNFHPGEEFISDAINFKDEGPSWLSFILQQENIFWLATHNGLVKIKPSAFNLFAHQDLSELHETFSFCQLRNGKILTGSNRGNVFELTEKGVRNFFPGGIKPVPNAEIKTMYEDERGWLWMGSGYQGIALYRQGKMMRFTEEANRLHDNSFYSFLPVSQNKIFAIGDKGMTEITIHPSDSISFKAYYSLPEITKYGKFYTGFKAPDGTIWIGGEEGLRFLKNDSLLKFSLLEKNIAIRAIKISGDNLVWIATEGDGIICCRFDEKNKLQLVKHYTENNGLNTVRFLDLFIDRQDNIWAGSVKGITVIGRAGKLKGADMNFSETEGFIKPGYYSSSIFEDSNGRILVGTSQGMATFEPGDLYVSKMVPTVYLMEVGLLKKNGSILNSDSLIADNALHQLSLPYDNNRISFNYTAINFSTPGAVQYYYRLQGQDTQWVHAGDRRRIEFNNLPAGKYLFSVKAVNDKGVWSKDITSFSFIIHPPFWQTWWFVLLVATIVIAIISIIVKQRVNSIKAKAGIQQQLAELEIKALRAQINPHFIFNAMNSIQQFTLINDTDNANLYISKFSKLLRKVLHSSPQNFITVQDEIEQLELYLDVETLRMGKDFSYSIIVDEEIEKDAVEIPGMLIQPFVENALKHGLSLKNGSKVLSISFKLKGDEAIEARITDNGIGRKKAEQLKERQGKLLPHDSKGIYLVEKRLQLLNFSAKNSIVIEDLQDASGNATGTSVTLILPLK